MIAALVFVIKITEQPRDHALSSSEIEACDIRHGDPLSGSVFFLEDASVEGGRAESLLGSHRHSWTADLDSARGVSTARTRSPRGFALASVASRPRYSS